MLTSRDGWCAWRDPFPFDLFHRVTLLAKFCGQTASQPSLPASTYSHSHSDNLRVEPSRGHRAVRSIPYTVTSPLCLPSVPGHMPHLLSNQRPLHPPLTNLLLGHQLRQTVRPPKNPGWNRVLPHTLVLADDRSKSTSRPITDGILQSHASRNAISKRSSHDWLRPCRNRSQRCYLSWTG